MQTDWQKIRKNYPATENYTYFNTASCGLMTTSATACNQDYQQALGEQGSVYRDTLFAEMQNVKEVVGDFIGTKAKDIALIPNFSSGINYIVPMLKSLGSVLLIENDYPSLTFPWQLHQYDVHWVPQTPQATIDLDQIVHKLRTDSIQILAISWVQYLTGFQVAMDELSKVCVEHGVLLIVDATQALGAVPIDLQNTHIDILISSCYKWATAGFGNGILYIHPDVVARFETPVIGKGSTGLFEGVYQPEQMKLQARIFEVGHYNYGAFLTLRQALQELTEIGQEAIYNRVQELTHYFQAGLPQKYKLISDNDPHYATGIVAIQSENKQLIDTLKQANIIVSARGEGLRISLHFYNTLEEVDRLLEVLEKG